MFSMNYGVEYINFKDGCPYLPINAIVNGGYDCVWLTSPLFCTGYYPDDQCLDDIKYLKSLGMTLIFDESLALPGKELIRTFPIDKETFAIYSPHKSLAINGLKFAVIVCDKIYEDFMEQWVDVFAGALSSSNRDAVFHYISPNYITKCYPAYKCYIEKVKSALDNLLVQYPFARILANTEGHYINIFTDYMISGRDELLKFINELIHTTFSSVIPSVLNGYHPNNGFGFRVNLTGDYNEICGAVGRIMQYLGNKYY